MCLDSDFGGSSDLVRNVSHRRTQTSVAYGAISSGNLHTRENARRAHICAVSQASSWIWQSAEDVSHTGRSTSLVCGSRSRGHIQTCSNSPTLSLLLRIRAGRQCGWDRACVHTQVHRVCRKSRRTRTCEHSTRTHTRRHACAHTLLCTVHSRIEKMHANADTFLLYTRGLQ